MISRNFVWSEDQEFGGEGWIMKGRPDFNSSDGRVIAHDVLEHFPDDTGGAHGECQALGAVLYGRGNAGMIGNGHSTLEENIASDILFTLRANGGEIQTAPATYRLSGRNEDVIQTAVRKAARDYPEENGNGERMSEQVQRDVISWLRIGYRRAARRYKNANLPMLFEQIQHKVETRFAQGDYLGEELKVSVSLKRNSVKVERVEYADEYY